MQRILLSLALVALLVGLAFAQGAVGYSDAPKFSTQDRTMNHGNSQLIYIHITMAGAEFKMENGDWMIGDTLAARSWYAYPGNTYLNAGGNFRGLGHFYGIDLAPSAAPYDGIFADDVPILTNIGGVALDFFLVVSPNEGFNFRYESAHSSNQGTDAAALTSGDMFSNGVQVRAIFCTGASTGSYGGNTTTNAEKFHYNNPATPGYRFNVAFPGIGVHPPALGDCQLVLTSSYFGVNGWTMTDDYGYVAGTTFSWAEATRARFNPVLGAGHLPLSANEKGLGLTPQSKISIAMEFLTPRLMTRAYRAAMATPEIVKLRVVGAISDAH